MSPERILTILVFIFNLRSLKSAQSVYINDRIQVLTTKQRALTLYKCSEQVPSQWRTPPWLQEPMSQSKFARLNETTSQLFQFRLKENIWHKQCTGEWVTAQFLLDDYNLQDNPNSTLMEKHLYMGFYFTFYGYLKFGDYFIPTERFCIQELNPTDIVVDVCLPNCDKDLCIKKICPLGMVARFDVRKPTGDIHCTETFLDEWIPRLYKRNENSSLSIESPDNYPAVYYLFHGACDNDNASSIRHVSFPGAVYSQVFSVAVTRDNELFERKSEDEEWKHLNSSDTAMDGVVFSNKDEQYLHHPEHEIVVYCTTPGSPATDYKYILMVVETTLFVIADIFLLLVVARYGFAWKDLTVNGWIVATFCFFRFCVLLLEMLEKQKEEFYSNSCFVSGAAQQFFRIVANMWFVIYAGDTWRTMRSKVPPYVLSKGRKRFIGYFFLGIGIPALISAISIALEIQKPYGVLRPHYCDNRWTYSVLPFVFHTVIPSMLLLMPSGVFAILILKSVRELEKDGIDEIRSKQARNFAQVLALVKVEWIFYLVIILLDPNQTSFWACSKMVFLPLGFEKTDFESAPEVKLVS
ncbi:unnamed protein product [Allacma fusca]|uniref:G-protein coupled receptors family 2 profile 2 domain-containing protein n=1 Tax=Allacma fusca TaxID=39272 RepID=A0A8J2M7X2_9HEXA|nr:unnamed protein product [Allacma fusca]